MANLPPKLPLFPPRNLDDCQGHDLISWPRYQQQIQTSRTADTIRALFIAIALVLSVLGSCWLLAGCGPVDPAEQKREIERQEQAGRVIRMALEWFVGKR